MLIKIRLNYGLKTVKRPDDHFQTLLHNPASNLAIFNLKEKQGFQPLSSSTRLQRHENDTRNYVVYSGVEPGIPPSGPPPSNILSWIVAVAIAIAAPFVNYKWGPLLKYKVETALKVTEDVVEAVEKVAEGVEKVAEDIADDLPADGELRKAVDFVEKLAERTAKEAGAVDDIIDKVQEEEEKTESNKSPNQEKSSNDQNVNN